MINDPDVWHNVLQFEVIWRKFSRQESIVPLASYTAEELQFAFDVWGDDLQWTDLNGWDTSGRIIARMALRIIVGLPLGRNGRLLEMSRLFANALIMGAGFINCLPPFLRPVAGPLLAARARHYQTKCQRMLIPLIEERIQIWRERKGENDDPVCAIDPQSLFSLLLSPCLTMIL